MNLTDSHSRVMNAPVDEAFYANIHAKLKARNYTRPNLGASAYGQLTRWTEEQQGERRGTARSRLPGGGEAARRRCPSTMGR